MRILESRDHAKYPSCGKKTGQLFKFTAEDLQGVHSPEEVGIYWGICGDCRKKFRSAARLEVLYRTRDAIRDASLTIPFSFGILFLVRGYF